MDQKNRSAKIITKVVLMLSLVSLFTDVASEMLYPVMPIYLESIGFSIVLIGILEGLAEAVAGLSKGYFGKMSDNLGFRLPFVRWGYFLSALSKPMMAIFTFPAWIFSARTIDRLGKGIRTGARDAMLSAEASAQTRATVFGFHRSMDTLGAVMGPIIALVFLYFYPAHYKTLFLLAFFPGLTAILITFLLKEKPVATRIHKVRTSFFDFFRYWKTSPKFYRGLVIGLLLFTLFNSSDVFLLLRLKESGMDDTYTIGIYVFYNLVYAIAAYPLGILADKLGLKNIFIAGLAIFAMVYGGMSISSGMIGFILLFFLYGIYAAATEGVSKAWISNLVNKGDTATAIGTYTGFQSICSMLASSIAGLLWYQFGSRAMFLTTSLAVLLVIIYVALLKSDKDINMA
ncbi:MFS transporter [Chitinophaga caeni]|uniref:MFS transporter n=1 Tax=Chitinophaga caeni TaxID=2029983 RepID=A0A291QWN0_9BACT|nr:MFS transporter [Chitinophaga caeni]ATL48264.1 MFS transporter [Chitinophaga caeni]